MDGVLKEIIVRKSMESLRKSINVLRKSMESSRKSMDSLRKSMESLRKSMGSLRKSMGIQKDYPRAIEGTWAWLKGLVRTKHRRGKGARGDAWDPGGGGILHLEVMGAPTLFSSIRGYPRTIRGRWSGLSSNFA